MVSRALSCVVFTASFLLCLTGCSGISAPPVSSSPQTQEILFTHPGSEMKVFGLRIDPDDGTLTQVPGSPYLVPNPTSIFLHLRATPDGHTLLVGGQGSFFAYPINSNGGLGAMVSAPNVHMAGAIEVMPGPGNLIYTANAYPGDVTTSVLDPQAGAISAPIAHLTCADSTILPCMELVGESPDGTTLWARGILTVSTGSIAELYPIAVDSLGRLTLPGGSVPSGVVGASPVFWNGGVAFVDPGSTMQVNATRMAFWNRDGELLQLCTAEDAPACAQAVTLALDPTLRFLFIGTQDNRIWSFPFDPASGISRKRGISFDLGFRRSSGMMVNSTGKFLYVLDNFQNTITGYRINRANGSLTPIGPPFQLSDSPGSGDLAEMGMTIAKVPVEH